MKYVQNLQSSNQVKLNRAQETFSYPGLLHHKII